MDAGNMGFGAGGSIVGAFLAWAGFKQRLDRSDKEMDDLKKAVVYKDTCGVCHAATEKAIDKIDKKLDLILEKISK